MLLGLALGSIEDLTAAETVSSAASEANRANVALGKRMYRDGILPSGQLMSATVLGDVPLTGAQLACANCHRRSGLGSTEGAQVAPPITGHMLYQLGELRYRTISGPQPEGTGSRPAYDDSTLARAIREGVNPTGRTFDPLMPRYSLSDADAALLIAYLKQFTGQPAPGVTKKVIRFATVVTEGVDAPTRRGTLEVLNTYIRDKNARTRNDWERVRRGPWYRNWKYAGYREWELDVWELKGSPETWAGQLEALYREHPVFALIGGLGTGVWRPIHEFCESFEVPCLFPDTDLPVVSESDYYNIYFSKGLALEAHVLARHLRDEGWLGPNRRVLQVFKDDEHSSVPAAAFRTALQTQGFDLLREQEIGDGDLLTAERWRDLLERERPTVLILWLDKPDLENLRTLGGPTLARLERIYLSSGLVKNPASSVPRQMRDRVHLTYPFDLPDNWGRRLLRPLTWMRARSIEVTDQRRQANAYFAATITGKALKHTGGLFSREFFVERIEHLIDSSLTTSVYPYLTLGPDQRYASKGAYIVELNEAGALTAVSGWIVP